MISVQATSVSIAKEIGNIRRQLAVVTNEHEVEATVPTPAPRYSLQL